MRRYNLLVRDLLRDSIQGYRKSQSYTQEAMAEKPVSSHLTLPTTPYV